MMTDEEACEVMARVRDEARFLFTGLIDGDILRVVSMRQDAVGLFSPGTIITGCGVLNGTAIVEQTLVGQKGGIGSYRVNKVHPVSVRVTTMKIETSPSMSADVSRQ